MFAINDINFVSNFCLRKFFLFLWNIAVIRILTLLKEISLLWNVKKQCTYIFHVVLFSLFYLFYFRFIDESWMMSSEATVGSLSTTSIINTTTMGSIPNYVVDNKQEVTPIFLQTQLAKGK